MKKRDAFFQSYLIVGDRAAQAEKFKEVCFKFGKDINKKSPDFQLITPQKSSIGIEPIRQLKKTIHQKPVYDIVKIVQVEDADTLTQEAQNSFLKLLEEPPTHAVFILLAKSQRNFLPTVLSRLTLIQAGYETTKASNIQGIDLQDLILHFTQHPDPLKLLDEEMTTLATQLKQIAEKDSSFREAGRIIAILEKLKKARQMIQANVNVTQVLIALAISLKSKNISL